MMDGVGSGFESRALKAGQEDCRNEHRMPFHDNSKRRRGCCSEGFLHTSVCAAWHVIVAVLFAAGDTQGDIF